MRSPSLGRFTLRSCRATRSWSGCSKPAAPARRSTASQIDPFHAFRYDLDTRVFEDLGSLVGPKGTSAAFGANIDGSVIVGTSEAFSSPDSTGGMTRIDQAFRWTRALGMQNIGATFVAGFPELFDSL